MTRTNDETVEAVSVERRRIDTRGETWLWDERQSKYVNPATGRTRDAENLPALNAVDHEAAKGEALWALEADLRHAWADRTKATVEDLRDMQARLRTILEGGTARPMPSPTPSESEREALVSLLEWETGDNVEAHDDLADAILAAGFRRHPLAEGESSPAPETNSVKVVETVEALKALPKSERIVLDRNGVVWQWTEDNHWCRGGDNPETGFLPYGVPLPATVLTPAASATVSAEPTDAQVEAVLEHRGGLGRDGYTCACGERCGDQRGYIRHVLRAAGLFTEGEEEER